MPVTTSYPGIYLEELPSSARTIVAAPTSIAVFVGYTHPYKTQTPGKPVQLFSYADYERQFGGLFTSNVFDHTVAHSVNQFFLNGGTEAHVVGIVPNGATPAPSATMSANLTAGIVFVTQEPVGPLKLKITVSRVDTGVADIVITYGRRVESYRKVNLTPTDNDYLVTRLAASTLVTVHAAIGGYPTDFTSESATLADNSAGTGFNASEFLPIFAADSALDKLPVFNLLAIPGVTDNGVLSTALAFCERRQAFLVMDPPPNYSADGYKATPASPALPLIADYKLGNGVTPPPVSPNGALYFPYMRLNDPLLDREMWLPPSGYVAGVIARTDANRGVWKAPAGLQATITNTTGVVPSGVMTDMRQGTLNKIAVNVIRSFPGSNPVVFGARTLVGGDADTAFQEHRYVPVRRLTLFIEQTLLANLRWVIFEPNDTPLWTAIRVSVEGFMLSLFRQGAFQGASPSQAFHVLCDSTTTTQTDIDNGKVNIVVMFAPVKPAEFVIIKIAQIAGQSPI
jgi:phage tail sheath protein FI